MSAAAPKRSRTRELEPAEVAPDDGATRVRLRFEPDGNEGVICGRSIYTGALDFARAQSRADELLAE